MSIFLERFVLPILAAVITGVVILNPAKWDIRQRVALTISVIAAAYFVGHTLTLKRTQEPATTIAAPSSSLVTTPPVTTGPITTTGPQSPVVIGGGTVSYAPPPEQDKAQPKGKKP